VSLAILLVLLGGAAWAQVAIGLQPLQALKRSLRDVQQAQTLRLEGHFPAEVQPLVEGFNSVLDRNGEIVARARTQAGNLAHALKTPLSVLECAAQEGALARQVHEQVAVARRHNWHLARSRVAATQRLPGQRTEVAPVLAGLVRVMERVHAPRYPHRNPDGAAPVFC
jgi:signal transduction histidine kinase